MDGIRIAMWMEEKLTIKLQNQQEKPRIKSFGRYSMVVVDSRLAAVYNSGMNETLASTSQPINTTFFHEIVSNHPNLLNWFFH